MFLYDGPARSATISIGGSPVVVNQSPNTPPPLQITSVSNAFGESFIAPNTWVSIGGTGLAPDGDIRTWQTSDFVNGRLPAQLDNVNVTVNGKSAFVYYISPTQVNILTPPDAIEGPVEVQLTNGGTASDPFTAMADQYSPAFFLIATAGSTAYVLAEHAGGGLIGPTDLFPGQATPAIRGETVLLFANGFGQTSSPVVSGSPTQSGTLPTYPDVTINGATASVLYAGLISPGLFQFNVVIPPSAVNEDNNLIATYNGIHTQPGMVITVGR